jgi:hypothetical protein
MSEEETSEPVDALHDPPPIETEAASEVVAYKPRKRAVGVKKPLRYPGNLIITGTLDMLDRIDELAPNEGNRRRESLILAEVWMDSLSGEVTPKSALVALAALAIQRTDKAFADQARAHGKIVTGFSRAKCTMAKTCHWMLTEGLFEVVDAEEWSPAFQLITLAPEGHPLGAQPQEQNSP